MNNAERKQLGELKVNEQMIHELLDQGYYPIDFANKISKEALLNNPTRTKGWISNYYFGSTFVHYQAYYLCGVGNMWPDFCYHPTEPGFVLSDGELNSSDGTGDTHQQFEEWFDENRKEIVRRAAEGLGIDWQEIEQLGNR